MTYQTEIPEFACAPLVTAVKFARNLADEVTGNLDPGEYELGQEVINNVARTCGRLCAEGCVRESFYRLEAIGQQLPPDKDRDAMFDFVSSSLAFGVLLKEEEPEVKIVELDALDGPMLKDIVSRRLGIFNDDELLEQMANTRENINGANLNPAKLKQYFVEQLTPIEDEAYDELATFCKGNVRVALALISYLVTTYPLYRSSHPEMTKKAQEISAKGLKPANPYSIGALDIRNLARFINESGFMVLPTSFCSETWLYFTDNPKDFEHYSVEKGQVTDVFSGNLPAIQKRHLPAVIEADSRD